MFSRYWGDRYFAPTYWPNAGDVIIPAEPDIVPTTVGFGRNPSTSSTFGRQRSSSAQFTRTVNLSTER